MNAREGLVFVEIDPHALINGIRYNNLMGDLHRPIVLDFRILEARGLVPIMFDFQIVQARGFYRKSTKPHKPLDAERQGD
jgi:hypothetical protein